MWLFIFYIVVTRFIWGITVNLWDTLSLSVLGFFITLGFACRYFNLEYGIKIYRIVAFISCIFFIMQDITYSLWGYSISGLLPDVPLSFNVSDLDYRQHLQSYFRQASFFREPAYFAQFLLPILCIELFNKRRKILFYLNALFITVVILLSASGCGFVGLIVIWLSWIFFELSRVFQLKQIIIAGFLISAVFFFGVEYIQSIKGNALIRRIESVSIIDKNSVSSFTRVYRGYYVYNEYNIIEKIVGINNPQLQKEKVQQSPVRSYFGNELYFNGIQSLLILTGVIGFGLMLLAYKALWIKNNNTAKVLLIILIVESLIEAIFINAHMLLYITILYSFKREQIIKTYNEVA
jgi:hypothetical protein